ncbi:amidohydrolase family protein [Sphingomonas soli]|uniref:amidohydrolase family protein n=1 Tax=Sphingomonas soli TaxID=266127 RepID=UPI00157B449B|nr:amidohydrolase family protein [Sphingomonas soli]
MLAEDLATAGFTLPAGSCDSHCHVFGPPEIFPYSPTRKYEPATSPKETLAALHARLGIERAVIVQASAHGTDNRAMLDAIRWRPKAWRGVAVIDDGISDAELEAMAEAGVRGIRFNFVKTLGGYPDPDLFARSVARVAPLGWHVVLHVMGEDVLNLRGTIRALRLPFVIDHMGRIDTALGLAQPAFETLLELVRLDGAWVKLSGAERISDAPYDGALPFARRIAATRPDRILWGTDFPHPNLPAHVEERDLVDLIPSYLGDAAIRQAMLVDNPARLYGFDEGGTD